MKNIFKGLGVALVTPFNEDGTIDYDALSKLLHYQESNGVDFFCVLGSTAETPCLSLVVLTAFFLLFLFTTNLPKPACMNTSWLWPVQ